MLIMKRGGLNQDEHDDRQGEGDQIILGPILIGVFNLYFGLFSGFIQTLVFSSLNAVWISQEMPEDDSMGTEKQVARGEPLKE